MPQMAPISWLTLFLLFSFSFIIFNIMNYYCLNNKTPKKINEKTNNIDCNLNKNNSLNWKW